MVTRLRHVATLLLIVGALLATGCSVLSSEPAEATIENPTLNLAPGQAARNSVEINGTKVDYLFFAPDGFEYGDTAPVLLAMPPGGQSLGTAEGSLNDMYLAQAHVSRWVVVSPAAPEGVKFFEGSESLIPGLIDHIGALVTIEGDKPHLAGISNGGLSAFRILAENPDGFRSMVVLPGAARSSADLDALDEIGDMPVSMFVGGNDEPWIEGSERALGVLEGNGADVTYEVLPGEGHLLNSLRGGDRVFEFLNLAR